MEAGKEGDDLRHRRRPQRRWWNDNADWEKDACWTVYG